MVLVVSDGPGIIRYLVPVKHIFSTLAVPYKHIWDIFDLKQSVDQLLIEVSNVNTWLVSVTALYVLRTLWLRHRLCLLLESDGQRREEHVAVVGQGVRPAHCGFSHAEQVAVSWLLRIELLCLGWGEKKVRDSKGTWGMGAALFCVLFFLMGHFHTVSDFIVGIILGDNENKEAVAVGVTQQTDKTFACRSKLTQSCHRSQKLLVWNQ